MADDAGLWELNERLRDVDRWVRTIMDTCPPEDPRRETAELILEEPPVRPEDVAAAEQAIRVKDPGALPARCQTCLRRLPMIQRSDNTHPKCAPPDTGEPR